MRLNRWLSIMLAICLLGAALTATLAEETELDAVELEIIDEETDEVVGEADEIGEMPDLILPEDDEDVVAAVADAEATGASASTGSLAYARVTKGSAPLYADYSADEAVVTLEMGETVLLLGEEAGLAAVAVNLSGQVVEGFMQPSQLAVLDESKVSAYLNKIMAGGVALYRDDVNWPLGPANVTVTANSVASNGSSNYDDLSNDTAFVMNGKSIKASDVESQGLHNCWKWANKIYKKAWGTSFDSTFTGKSGKDLNLLRNMSPDERKLTPENLKYFVRNSVPGATLRVTDVAEPNNSDSSGNYLHSLIIAEIRTDGLVTMDDQNKVHTRFYTWEGFCKAWAKWDHIKYIKWPNAPALPSASSVDGYSVSDCSDTYRVRATATKGVGVYAKPSDSSPKATLAYPETFAASKMALKTVNGYSWVYGKTSTGVTGWLPLTDGVVNVKDTVKVTGVTLNQTQLALLKGGTATLKATVAPVDATKQSVTWSSSDTGIATVKDGVVTGTGGGTATITVTTEDGSKKATCTVVVASADVSKTLSKTGSNGTVKLAPGQQLQLVPKFATKKGWKVKKVKSSKSKVASVNSQGVVTAKKAGTATITVTTKNKKKATIKVKVVDPSAPTKVVLSKSGTVKMKKGATGKLYAKVSPATATTTLTWKSSKPSVATVDSDGNVTALKAGKCTIGVMTENGKYDTVKIWVK